MNKKILIATKIDNIPGLKEKISNCFKIVYFPNLISQNIDDIDDDISVIFTNPNNSKVFYGEEFLSNFQNLGHLVTASTGTIHIDKDYILDRGIKLISISKSYSVLNKITSTAEQAFLLTMAGLRNFNLSVRSVDDGVWDYSPFTGRQLNALTVGVMGFGRLGKMYAHYAKSFGAKVICCDPYKINEVKNKGYLVGEIEELFAKCDVVSLHIHADKENLKIVNAKLLKLAKSSLLLVNTSRGEIVNENELLKFLQDNPEAKYFTDVITNEHLGVVNSMIYQSDLYGSQIFITPHCGGMTFDARKIAYHHAADLLLRETQTIS